MSLFSAPSHEGRRCSSEPTPRWASPPGSLCAVVVSSLCPGSPRLSLPAGPVAAASPASTGSQSAFQLCQAAVPLLHGWLCSFYCLAPSATPGNQASSVDPRGACPLCASSEWALVSAAGCGTVLRTRGWGGTCFPEVVFQGGMAVSSYPNGGNNSGSLTSRDCKTSDELLSGSFFPR